MSCNTVGLCLVRLKHVSKEADSHAYTHHRTVQSGICSKRLGGVMLCPGLQTVYYVRIYAKTLLPDNKQVNIEFVIGLAV